MQSSSSCRALAYTTSCRSAGELVAPRHLQGVPGLLSHSAPVGVPTAPARLARILLAAGCSAYPVRDVDNSRFARWQGREGPLRYCRPGVLSVNPARRNASAIASPLAGAGLLRPACVSAGRRRFGAISMGAGVGRACEASSSRIVSEIRRRFGSTSNTLTRTTSPGFATVRGSLTSGGTMARRLSRVPRKIVAAYRTRNESRGLERR